MPSIKKYLIGLTAVAIAVVYSLRRWRSSSPDLADSEPTPEQESRTAS